MLDVLIFLNDNNECYFNTIDMSLITIRLDDAVMESNEDGEFVDQFLLNQVSTIRKGIVKLVSSSLIR